MVKKTLLAVTLLIFIGIWVVQGIYLPDVTSSGQVDFHVKSGQGVFEIAERLEQKNLIKNDWWFTLYTLVKGQAGHLKAGTYRLDKSMSVAEILQKIISGEVVSNKITVIEGWSVRDIGLHLQQKGWCDSEDFFEMVGYPATDYSVTNELKQPEDFSDQFDFLKSKPSRVGLEGFLFPDTYYFSKQDGLRQIVVKMLDNFDRKLNDRLKQEIKQQDKSIFEIVTMASLLEKEVKTMKDKKIVSGVLWKRLRHGIPLQVDATIAYITGKRTTKISKRETEIDSTFNTYKYRGLPVDPICNPGLESIEAAIYPTESDYWYYLSVSGGCSECTAGGTVFSRSLKEHNIAKAKYLK